jgi:hypothetical protein
MLGSGMFLVLKGLMWALVLWWRTIQCGSAAHQRQELTPEY